MARPKRKDPVALVCTLAVVFVVAVATSLLVVLGAEPEQQPAEGSLSGPWASGAREGRLPGSEGPLGDEETFRYQLNGTPVFSAGSGEGNPLLENTAGNLYPMEVCYQLEETGETVFASGLLPPGSYLETGTLSQSLEPGEYPARAVIRVYDQPGGEEVVSFEEEITLTVQP
ncbi:MAG TPA: hypothetical protein H9680_01620 [Firmicutes bacterium]|nr:hypothetical protein [Bacillota bacterium]